MRWFRWGDAIPAAIVLVASVACLAAWLSADTGAVAVVQTPDGVHRFSLAEDGTHRLQGDGYALTVVLENGRVRVTDAACPDKVCEHTGAISRTAESIACVPCDVIVTIEGASKTDAPDGVAR